MYKAKAVILAGGLGTRLGEETDVRPKPMVEIAGMPIIWHIMKIYSAHGVSNFVICLGYKGYIIKEFFANYFLHTSDVTLNLVNNSMQVHQNWGEPWQITLVETGADTMTGGRIKAIRPYLNPDEPFCLTYGDGVADIDLTAQLEFHMRHGRKATITAVTPPGRFGALAFEDDLVTRFHEKPAGDGALINGGFPTTVNPSLQYGLTPVFVDIDIPTYNIRPDMIEAAVSDRTRAIMIAHALGKPSMTERRQQRLSPGR